MQAAHRISAASASSEKINTELRAQIDQLSTELEQERAALVFARSAEQELRNKVRQLEADNEAKTQRMREMEAEKTRVEGDTQQEVSRY